MHVFNPLSHLTEPHLARHAPFIAVVDDALTGDECDGLIARIESLSPSAAPVTTNRGFVHRPDIRNNERVMFDDLELAADLFARVREIAPATLREGVRHTVSRGLNERFRGYRYSAGQRFAPHYDGAFRRDSQECSELTVLFYLNEGFIGGKTTFCDWEVSVEPRRGRALLFTHHTLHAGDTVEEGRKYVLRSDLMYRAGA